MADPRPGPLLDWAEKYRPRSLADVVGNGQALARLKAWADAWEGGEPARKAVILEGMPGVGKTSAAHALARDMGWGLLELNASDARNAEAIRRVATSGAVHQTFTDSGEFLHAAKGGRKLIVLDEADNLYERGDTKVAVGEEVADYGDRGGKRQILATIRETKQPVVLIANDYYGLTRGAGAALRELCETIRFHRVEVRSLTKALGRVAQAEGVDADEEALRMLAERSEGDMRSAINDLQSACLGKKVLTLQDVKNLGYRDRERTLFDVLPLIFKTESADAARKSAWEIDEDPESLILWIDENLPLEYKSGKDLAAGFQALSRADVFLGRVRRRRYYGLWGYASEMMTAGVALAKAQRYHGWTRYAFPQWLLRMSRTKGTRGTRDSLAGKLAVHTHTSTAVARVDLLPYVRHLAQVDEEFAVELTRGLELTDDELGLLLAEKASSKRVESILDRASEGLEAAAEEELEVVAAPPARRGKGTSTGKTAKSVAQERARKAKAEEQEAEPASEEPEPEEKEEAAPQAKKQKSLFEY